MGGLDVGTPRPPQPNAVEPLTSEEMQNIRNVFDEDSAGKKLCSFISPREDARMFRNADTHAVSCECIVELYELLWRWGHRNTAQGGPAPSWAGSHGFAQNFGFAIPDTIVIVKGKPYAWYFISQKDGRLLRKSEVTSALSTFEKKFCHLRNDGETSSLAATWMPIASQFPEARCHSPHAEFLSAAACRSFLMNLRASHSGVLQAFVQPHGVYNFLVRTVTFHSQTSLCVRTNRSLMAHNQGTWFSRAATFEGWDGLSSTSSRYRSHKHPQMEELILAVGETLNMQIEQERVRQMLFLDPTQHIALHFKVTQDHMLYFIYASVIQEKEVILQTRPQLLMGDECMTDNLPGSALLAGGSDRKAIPHDFPKYPTRNLGTLDLQRTRTQQDQHADKDSGDETMLLRGLPPILQGRSETFQNSPRPDTFRSSGGVGQSTLSQTGNRLVDGGSSGYPKPRRRPLSERRLKDSLLPRMPTARPDVPDVPFRIHRTPHSVEESGRYECMPPFLGLDVVKRPLISVATSRSEPPITARQPADATNPEPSLASHRESESPLDRHET